MSLPDLTCRPAPPRPVLPRSDRLAYLLRCAALRSGLAITAVTAWTYALLAIRNLNEEFGVLIICLRQIMRKDVSTWIVLYILITAGFSQALHCPPPSTPPS